VFVRSFLILCGLLVAVGAAGAAPVLAAPPNPAHLAGPPERILGIVPVHDQVNSARPSTNSNLTYHGGPVMHQNRVYTIFWGSSSSWDSGYISTINKYFADVAADSGKSTNVYFSDTQYTDSSGSIAYSVNVGGSFSDTTPYPANGCTDKATAICLSDGQLQTEVENAMTTNNWNAVGADGVQSLFLVFTPKGVGSCAQGSCAYTNYCAYHSWMGSGSGATLYANQPYAVQNYRIYTCDSGQRPNGVTADATVNLISHEHNEAITDEQGSAWYDSRGSENGDKCAWNFGTTSGPTGAKYNQTINGSHYYLQQEWSNHSSGCVLTGS
jgi:hypothetical protein